MKKFLFILICLVIVLSFCGCAPKTEYDGKEISKIESSWMEGMAPFPCRYVRTFDFNTGKVTDTAIAENLSEEQLEQYADYIAENCNKQISVTEFGEENAREFTEKIISLSFYSWKDSYIQTDIIICDGNCQFVTVYFSDGTVKSTYIYYKDPPNYNKILSAFENYLGADLYYGQ